MVSQLFGQMQGDFRMGVPAGIESLAQAFQYKSGSAGKGQSLTAAVLASINLKLNSLAVAGIGGGPG